MAADADAARLRCALLQGRHVRCEHAGFLVAASLLREIGGALPLVLAQLRRERALHALAPPIHVFEGVLELAALCPASREHRLAVHLHLERRDVRRARGDGRAVTGGGYRAGDDKPRQGAALAEAMHG